VRVEQDGHHHDVGSRSDSGEHHTSVFVHRRCVDANRVVPVADYPPGSCLCRPEREVSRGEAGIISNPNKNHMIDSIDMIRLDMIW
jgi:hypothetical protein